MSAAAASSCDLRTSHATRWDEVRRYGRIVEERRGKKMRTRYRIDFGMIEGHRWILSGTVGQTGAWAPFRSREAAEDALASIHGDMVARNLSIGRALRLWSDRGPTDDDLIEQRVEVYLRHFRELVGEGQRSPTSLRELERYARSDGHWCHWSGRPIQGVAFADVEAWHRVLATRSIKAKTRKNVSDAFRAMLRWWADRDPSIAVPRFPSIRVPVYVPTIIDMDDQAKILNAINWCRRGAFLAAAYEALRMGEIRALDLGDYTAGRLRVTKAMQGPRLDAPVGPTKNNAGEVRELWHPELVRWIEWRLAQATAEQRIAGAVALFWNPTARNAAKRWTPDPMEREWARACKVAGVSVPFQEGTRHAILTQLGGALPEKVLQAFSRHASSKSLAHYAQPRAKAGAIVRAIRRDE